MKMNRIKKNIFNSIFFHNYANFAYLFLSCLMNTTNRKKSHDGFLFFRVQLFVFIFMSSILINILYIG